MIGIKRGEGQVSPYQQYLAKADKLLQKAASAATTTLVGLEEELETLLEETLGMTVTTGLDSTTVDFMPDNTPGNRALKLHLSMGYAYDQQHPLNLDLSTVGLEELNDLIDFEATGTFRVRVGADLAVDLGVDLKDPKDPRPFLYQSTTASIGAKFYGSNVQFELLLVRWEFPSAMVETTTVGL